MPITIKLTDNQINAIALKKGWTAKILEADNPITAKEFVLSRYFDNIFREFAEVRKEAELATLEAEKKATEAAIATTKSTEVDVVKAAILS